MSEKFRFFSVLFYNVYSYNDYFSEDNESSTDIIYGCSDILS